jgi:hypothetical protein
MKTFFGLSLICAFAASAFGQVGTSLTRSYYLPPIGLASTETAQLNVVNVVTSSSAESAAPSSCAGTISFANAAGKAIGSPVSFTTTGFEVFSTQLTFSQLGATGARGEFTASIQLTGYAPMALCSLEYSIETFDQATGVTHAYFGNATGTPVALRFSPVVRQVVRQ